jgi:diacylglycerol kinase (ATP)
VLASRPRPELRGSALAPVRGAPLLLVANANASGLAGSRELVDGATWLLRRSGARVETRPTTSVEELAEVLRETDSGRLVLLGGDGTLHALANVDAPALPEVALIPAGRANNVARSLGIPTDLRAAARLAVEGGARPLDLIAAVGSERTHLAVEGVSVGFHALARAGYNGANSADLVAGALTGLSTLARFRPMPVAIESDGRAEVARLSQLFVANLPLYSFGLHVAPAADPADGFLDLVAIEATSRPALVATLVGLRRGVDRPGIRRWRASRVRVSTGGRSPVVADSTLLGRGPVELTVAHDALRVVAP